MAAAAPAAAAAAAASPGGFTAGWRQRTMTGSGASDRRSAAPRIVSLSTSVCEVWAPLAALTAAAPPAIVAVAFASCCSPAAATCPYFTAQSSADLPSASWSARLAPAAKSARAASLYLSLYAPARPRLCRNRWGAS